MLAYINGTNIGHYCKDIAAREGSRSGELVIGKWYDHSEKDTGHANVELLIWNRELSVSEITLLMEMDNNVERSLTSHDQSVDSH